MASNRIYLQVDLNSENAQQNVNAINKGIGQLGPTAEKSTEQASRGIQRVSVSVEQASRSFNELGQALAGLGIARIVTGLVQLGSEMERVQRAMATFTGNADQAAKVFEQIRGLAADSKTFDFKQLEEAGRQLLAFGASADKVPAYLKAITDQVAAFGGGMSDVNDMIRIFGRIMSKDFVGAMDLFRGMGAKGIEITEALRAALSKEFGRPVGLDEFERALQQRAIDPMMTWETVLQAAQKRTKDFDKSSQDAAGTFKQLGNAIQIARTNLGEAFDKAFANLARELANILAPVAKFLEILEKLPEPTKEMIVNLAAFTAAVIAFGGAWKIAATIAGPAIDLITFSVKALGKALLFALANPELVLAVTAITLVLGSLYLFVPQVTKAVNSLFETLKGKFTGWSQEIQKAMGIGDVIPTGKLGRESEKGLDELQKRVEKFSDEASQTLLKAFDSPVEAVTVKYAKLFQDLNKDIASVAFNISPEHATQLRAQLGSAQAQEEAAAGVKEARQRREEQARLDLEKVKGSTDAQVAYIEAKDAQTLREKVAAIDQITELRIKAEDQVAAIQKNTLAKQFADFESFVKDFRQVFIDAGLTQQQIDDMVATHRKDMVDKAKLVDQKAADESQKYRLEGWKKANDAIIEDQKRIYQGFRDIFDQVFDALTDKTKGLGQALGDVFKKLALGEIKETFSSFAAGAATQAAGYGRPEESLPGGGRGLLGILLRRGMPPRGPLAPPVPFQPTTTESGIVSGAAQLTDSANAQRDAAQDLTGAARALEAAAISLGSASASPGTGEFSDTARGARMDFGSQYRRYITGGPPADVNAAIDQAAAQTGVPANLLRAVAQTESRFRAGAVSSKGAMGIMQLMPDTAKELGVTAPFDVQQNIMGGARKLRKLLDQYGGNVPLALAAYNAGPGAVARAGGIPSYTQGYIAQVMGAAGSTMASTTGTAQSSFVPYSYGMPFTPPPAGGMPAEVPLFPEAPQLGVAGFPEAPQIAMAQPGGPGVENLLKTLGLSGGLGGPGAQTAAATTAGGAAKQLFGLAGLAQTFGIGGTTAGGTSIRSVLESQGVGALAGMAGLGLATQGLQRRIPALTVAGGALGGVQLGQMLGMGWLQGPLTGAGLGLVAAGLQRGGVGGLAMDVGGGALTGGMIGLRFGGPVGGLIGAAIGAAAGAIAGTIRLFVKTEQERIRQQIKQVYGIDISNRQILTQIQQIIDQKYGGSVSIGIRSQDVQDIVRLYALSQGQAANLPRPMYSATIAESGGGVALQPVYQGGQLVQNPYTGPTTYQYQTAVTLAQGLKAGTSQGVPGATGLINNTWIQLNAQQAQNLMTGQVVGAIQSNPSAVASAGASAARAGDSRMTTTAAMTSPLTALP